MKTRSFLLASLFCAMFFIAQLAQGATVEDIVGQWSATYHHSLKVSGYFSDRSVSDGDVSFYPTFDPDFDSSFCNILESFDLSLGFVTTSYVTS
jgi:hypothetical protein